MQEPSVTIQSLLRLDADTLTAWQMVIRASSSTPPLW